MFFLRGTLMYVNGAVAGLRATRRLWVGVVAFAVVSASGCARGAPAGARGCATRSRNGTLSTIPKTTLENLWPSRAEASTIPRTVGMS